ncbi:MAG: hypothetical protein LQ351_002348 [Letrouitia transgressa]|nr:MAG: hypothetical protein LQ351_002348 [Letrouitia transgressa]
MATCHSLRLVGTELLGDPMDLKMFEFTGWSFDEFQADPHVVPGQARNNTFAPVARPPAGTNFADDDTDGSSPDEPTELYTVKAFEFVSHLRRASVIVQQGRAPIANVYVYVKGAPECMKDVCKASSLPSDYEELLYFYTHRGFRVIACASKELQQPQCLGLQEIKRIDVESELDFIGFIIFENKLKNATKKVISELTDANIRNVMCTGDNILTAISVGRECGLIDTTAHCFVPHFTKGDFRDPEARLKWQSVDNPVFELDEGSLLPLPTPASSDVSLPYDVANLLNFSLAITGDVFRWIVEHGDERILQRMLVAGQIFARMSPDEKHELVEKLQSINYCCSFCGDGANDCGALKAADLDGLAPTLLSLLRDQPPVSSPAKFLYLCWAMFPFAFSFSWLDLKQFNDKAGS